MKVTLAFLAVVGTALAGCSEYVDGQPQCSSSSAAPAACSEYVDGQPQCSSAAPAPSAACSEYVDGQPQCSSAPAPAPVSAAPTSSAGYTYPSVTPPASETSPYIPPVPPHPSCWASTVIPEAGATETIPIPINTCTMKSMYATGSGYGTGYGTGYGAATGTGYGASSTYTGPAIATGNGAQGLPTAAPALLLGAMGVMAML